MSLSPVQVGTPNDVIWGTNGVYATGRIVSGGRTKSIKADPSLNNDGVQTGDVLIKDTPKYDFEMECETNVTLPNEGDTNVNICNDANCVIDSVAETWRRGARKQAKITAHGYPS